MRISRTKIERWAFTGALIVQVSVLFGGLSVGQSVAQAGTAGMFLAAPFWLVSAALQLPDTVAYLRNTWRTSVPRVTSLTALMAGSAWLIQGHTKHAHLDKSARLEFAFWCALAATILCAMISLGLAYRDLRRSQGATPLDGPASHA